MLKTQEVEVLPLYYDYVLTQNYPVVILVGGRNSGKSFFMEQLAVTNIHNKRKYKLLVIEDVETNIGEGVKSGIEERAEEFGLDGVMSSTKQPAEIRHNMTGNNVIFKGYHSDAQQKQVKSLNEITAAWYEEAENITYNQFKALRMQLRGGDEEDRQLFLTLNPINSDSFINQYFFQQQPDIIYERFKDGRPKVFVKNITVDLEGDIVTIPCIVVVSVHWDNPYLTREQRADIEELKQTDPQMHEMLAEGKFIRPAGTFFKEFNPGIHVVEPFVIPDHWRRYTTKDYGLDMLANYWIAVDEQNRAYVYKELYESDLIISEAAKRIEEVNGTDKIHSKYAPPDLWNRRQETGKSAAEIFRTNGEMLIRSSNERVQGWLNVKEWLKVIEVRDEQTGELIKTARLKIWSNCVNLIRCIPQLLKDERDPNDVANEPHELTHAPDALRGWCITRPVAAIKPVEQDDINPTPQEKHQKAIKAMTGGKPNTAAFTRW
jgi:phage terminase large subunit